MTSQYYRWETEGDPRTRGAHGHGYHSDIAREASVPPPMWAPVPEYDPRVLLNSDERNRRLDVSIDGRLICGEDGRPLDLTRELDDYPTPQHMRQKFIRVAHNFRRFCR